MMEQRHFTLQLSNGSLKLSYFLVVPDNNKVFAEKRWRRLFFAYFDIVFSRGGSEWPFPCQKCKNMMAQIIDLPCQSCNKTRRHQKDQMISSPTIKAGSFLLAVARPHPPQPNDHVSKFKEVRHNPKGVWDNP